MSLLIALLKDKSYDEALELLNTKPKAAYDKDDDDISCIFFSLSSFEVTKLLLNIAPELIRSVGCRGKK